MEKRKEKTEPRPPEGGATNPGERPEGVAEIGRRKGPDPSRYGDWEVNGRCVDF